MAQRNMSNYEEQLKKVIPKKDLFYYLNNLSYVFKVVEMSIIKLEKQNKHT